MIFRRKKPKRLYYPTKSSWYRRPKRQIRKNSSKRIFTHNIRTSVSRVLKDSIAYVIGFILLVGMIVFLLFSSRFAVQNIEVARDDLHIDSAAVSNLLQDQKGKSIFSFSKTNARNMILEAYPEFARVEVRKVLPNTIKIELETQEIVANIKAYYVLPKVENTPAIQDDENVIEIENFESAFSLNEGEVTEKDDLTPIEQRALLNRIGQAIFDREEDLELMLITVDGLSQPIEDREIVVPTEGMEYILDSIKYLTNLLQMEVASVRFLPIAREVHLTTADNLTLWISMEKSYKDQIDKLNTIYRVAELDKENLSYIDLRVKEKLIYCPVGARCDG